VSEITKTLHGTTGERRRIEDSNIPWNTQWQCSTGTHYSTFLEIEQQPEKLCARKHYGSMQICRGWQIIHREQTIRTAALDLAWSMTSSNGYAPLSSSTVTVCSNPNLASSVLRNSSEVVWLATIVTTQQMVGKWFHSSTGSWRELVGETGWEVQRGQWTKINWTKTDHLTHHTRIHFGPIPILT